MSESKIDPHDEDVKIYRREFKRIEVSLGLTMTSESNFFVGFADNISDGGLFVATQQLVTEGSEVELELRLPDGGEPVRARAEVRWQRHAQDLPNGALPGFGARFIDLPEESRARLDAFLKEREPLFYPEE